MRGSASSALSLLMDSDKVTCRAERAEQIPGCNVKPLGWIRHSAHLLIFSLTQALKSCSQPWSELAEAPNVEVRGRMKGANKVFCLVPKRHHSHEVAARQARPEKAGQAISL
jgi:hypothetical protein